MGADPPEWMQRRCIRILNRDDRLLIFPICRGAFEPFPLPRLPISQLLWCQNVCQLFLARHRACLTVLLLLNRRSLRWQPLISTQRCVRDSSELRFRPTDFSNADKALLIVGSFQCSGTTTFLAAKDAVPLFNGMHVIQQRRRRATWIFVASGGQVALAPPAVTVIDDPKQAIDQAADRIQLS